MYYNPIDFTCKKVPDELLGVSLLLTSIENVYMTRM